MFSILLWLMLQANLNLQIPWQTIQDLLQTNPADTLSAVEPTKDPVILHQSCYPENALVDSLFNFSLKVLRHAKERGIVKDSFALTEAEKLAGKIPGDTLFIGAKLMVNGKNRTVFLISPNREGNLPIVRACYDQSEEVVRLEYITNQGEVKAVALL